MSTKIRSEISKKNPYYIEKHRYYELKHFCLQYPDWKRKYNALIHYPGSNSFLTLGCKTNTVHDPIVKDIDERLFYSERINMLERIARETDAELSYYILKAITEGISYDCMRVQMNIPCCKDTYYNLYRRFFWLLSKTRQ